MRNKHECASADLEFSHLVDNARQIACKRTPLGFEHEKWLGTALAWDCRDKALAQYQAGSGPAV